MLQCYNCYDATMLQLLQLVQCRIQCVSASYLSSLGSQCPAAPRPGAAPTTAQPHHPSWKICTLPSLSSAPSHIWTISWKALFLNSIYFTDEHFLRPSQTIMDPVWLLILSLSLSLLSCFAEMYSPTQVHPDDAQNRSFCAICSLFGSSCPSKLLLTSTASWSHRVNSHQGNMKSRIPCWC